MNDIDSRFNDDPKCFSSLTNNLKGYIDIGMIQEIHLTLMYIKYVSEKKVEFSNYPIDLPNGSDWQAIKSLRKDIINGLKKIFSDIENSNSLLKNVFAYLDIDAYTEFENTDTVLIDLIQIISDLDFCNISFGKIFDNQLYVIVDGSGKYGKDYLQPKELSQLIVSLYPEKVNLKIYNPYAGLASFCVFNEKPHLYFGQEINSKTCALARLRLLAYERFDSKIAAGDSVNQFNPLQENYDVIVANPTFGLKKEWGTEDRPYKEYENDFIYNAIRCLTDKGKVIAVLPQSFFSDRRNESLRKELVKSDIIENIIAFPSGTLSYTGMMISVIVLSKNKKVPGMVSLMDASEFVEETDKRHKRINHVAITDALLKSVETEFVMNVTVDDIIHNEYNLGVHRYFIKNIQDDIPDKTIELGKLIQIIDRERTGLPEKGKFIRIRDLADDPINSALSYENVEEVILPRHAAKLPDNCILFALRWSTLKPTFYKGVEELFYSYPDIAVCQLLDERINIEFLIHELYKSYVLKQVKMYRIGTSVPTLRKEDLLKIQIRVLPLSKQNEEILEIKRNFLQKKELELSEVRHDVNLNIASENSFLRHQIAGPLRNIRRSFENLKMMIDNQIANQVNGVYDMKSSEDTGLNFGKHLEILERDIHSIHKSVMVVGQEIDLANLMVERIDVIEFVREYSREIDESVLFKHKFSIIDDGELENNNIRYVFINGDKNLLRSMFDNIVENAVKHAFCNSISIRNRLDIDILFNFDEMMIHIDFSNTGNPMPENFSYEHFIMKSTKAGSNAGEGLGGWFIYRVMEIHGGELEIIDETGEMGIEPYATTFQLYFPVEIEKDDDEI